MTSSDENGEDSRHAEESTGQIDSKIARLIDEYDLGPSYGEQLEKYWTADGDERESLRALAERFNQRLLESAMTEAGMAKLDGEISNLYRLLTDEGVSSGNRIEAKERLRQAGVKVEQLESDFVTYQAVRTYLKNYRGAEYTRGSESDRVDSTSETIERLESRLRSVAERHLKQLRKGGVITLGDFRLVMKLTVLCETCNSQYDFVELLRNRGCECEG